MKQAQLIYIMGDIHCRWGGLNRFIDEEIRHGETTTKLLVEHDELEILAFVCGDFGYWPHHQGKTYVRRDETLWLAYALGQIKERPKDEVFTYDQYAIEHQMDGIKDGHVKIYWCDGNHENHDALNALEAKHRDEDFIPIMPWVFFARFGSILTLLDGTRVMFCGGAQNTDKDTRVEGESWWAGEEIDEADMVRLPDPANANVHWLISHTCPTAFVPTDFDRRHFLAEKNSDPSRRYLEQIRDRFSPEQWWFGHYHISQSGTWMNCRWAALDCLESHLQGRWYETCLLTRDTERPEVVRRRGRSGAGAVTVFFDTEFNDWEDPELISIGAITADGKHEFYGEVTLLPINCTDFVKDRVLPQLTGPAYSVSVLGHQLLCWLATFKTELELCASSDVDRELLEKLLAGNIDSSLHPIPRPNCFWRLASFDGGIPGPHHALEDARLLRERFQKEE